MLGMPEKPAFLLPYWVLNVIIGNFKTRSGVSAYCSTQHVPYFLAKASSDIVR